MVLQTIVELPGVELLDTVNIPSEGPRHKFITIQVNAIDPENPSVAIPTGFLGVARLMAMNVSALDRPFRVVWNGNVNEPELRFDSWPETPAGLRVQLEVWGT